MKNIRIEVAGEPGAGKSTIAQFIQKCLAQVGIEATIKDEVELAVSEQVAAEKAADLEGTFQPRLKALTGREEFKVEIATAQLRRIAL